MSPLHIAANIFHKIIRLVKLNIGKSTVSAAVKTQGHPEPDRRIDDWMRAGNSIIIIKDADQFPQPITLRYSRVGKSRMGSPVHIFALPGGNSKIEIGIVPDFRAPYDPFILFVKGVNSSATVFLNNREASINRSKPPRPAYLPQAVRRSSAA